MIKGLISLLLMSNVALIIALETECPPADSMKCSCRRAAFGPSVLCSGDDIKSEEDLTSTLNALKNYDIDKFTVKDITLPKAEVDMFKGLHIHKLTFENVNVIEDSFKEGLAFFQGLEDTLRILDIANCYTTGYPLKHFKADHLKKLELLMMTHSRVDQVGNDWFPTGPEKLESIIFVGNGIKELGNEAFQKLHNLKILWLTENPLTEITRLMFPSPAPYLEKISLESNKISVLPSDIFHAMPHLMSVILDKNLIQTIKEDVWPINLKDMARLYLIGNPIRCDNDVKWLCDIQTNLDALTCDSPADKKGIIFRGFCDMKS